MCVKNKMDPGNTNRERRTQLLASDVYIRCGATGNASTKKRFSVRLFCKLMMRVRHRYHRHAQGEKEMRWRACVPYRLEVFLCIFCWVFPLSLPALHHISPELLEVDALVSVRVSKPHIHLFRVESTTRPVESLVMNTENHFSEGDHTVSGCVYALEERSDGFFMVYFSRCRQ